MIKSLVMNDNYFFNQMKSEKSILNDKKIDFILYLFLFSEDFEKLSKQGTFAKARWFNTLKKE
jgi:hypothetical protein